MESAVVGYGCLKVKSALLCSVAVKIHVRSMLMFSRVSEGQMLIGLIFIGLHETSNGVWSIWII
jgi:hypothetical protein